MPRDQDVKLCDISCELVHQTDSAFLINDGDREVWIPKSMAEWDENSSTLTLPEWKAKQEGLI